MKKLYLMCLLILLGCSQNKQKDVYKIEQLLSQGKITQAYNRFKKDSMDNPQLIGEILLQANIHAAACFEHPDSLPVKIDSLLKTTSTYYHQLFTIDTLKTNALFNYGTFCYHQEWFDSAACYLKKCYEMDSTQTGCIPYLLSSFINISDWQQSSYWGKISLKKMLIAAKWYLLEIIKNLSFPEPGILIVADDECKATDRGGSTKSFKKYDIVEYIGSDLNTYHIKNKQLGWIPEDMKWFRGIFEKADYSQEGNIYTSPGGGYRVRKNLVKSGSVRRLKSTATSTSGLGIVRSGWYQVEFELTAPMTIPKNQVIPCLGSNTDEENRVRKLKSLSFLNEDTKQRLLESLIAHKMPLYLFEISIPYARVYKFIPAKGKVKVIYQFNDVHFIFENGYLINWFTKN